MMKTVYEIRLKLSATDNPDFLETEVGCFDAAVMIMLGCRHNAALADSDYPGRVRAWTTEAVAKALLACPKPAAVGKGTKKFKECLQQRKEYLERAQDRLQALKQESDNASKKKTLYSKPLLACARVMRRSGTLRHRCSSSACRPRSHARRRSCRPSSTAACPPRTPSLPAKSICKTLP